MSSDGFFDEDLDSAVFEQLDAIESAHFSPKRKTAPTASSSRALVQDDSFSDLTFDIDEEQLQLLDAQVANAYAAPPAVAGPSRGSRNGSGATIQTTLFGGVATVPTNKAKAPISRNPSLQKTTSASRNVFGRPSAKTKEWDQTVFAKTGLGAPKRPKGKGKSTGEEGEEEEEGEYFEFEQFPAPFVPSEWTSMRTNGTFAKTFEHWPPPMKLTCDLLETRHWIYPLNRPKRDYQYNIVKHCLFDNTLVALPTGLGKTFIAGVVMLNYYRWFPEGKVIFVAPTKPLVGQQIEACHQTCGIPGSDAAELTGQVPSAQRAKLWDEKRVFFMTPQTLVNDLKNQNCDVSKIILLVIDEAHKGSGNYAYAQVVRYLMAKNPHFRVLALTATPGSDPDAVQGIVDALHISHIEIRNEDSLDLQQYIHKKTIKQHIIKKSEEIERVAKLLADLMMASIKPLKDRGVLQGAGDPYRMHSFYPQALMRGLGPNSKWAYAPLSKLSSLCRVMGHLLDATQNMAYNALVNLAAETGGEDGKHDTKAQKLRSDPKYQALLKEFDQQRNQGFPLHPKMDMLKTLIIQHFASHMDDGDGTGETKVMVFTTFRDCVEEIVDVLNMEKPLIRATKFVGQATSKNGLKGFAQKEQIEVIKQFKQGTFNVIVATSIGEEGLDIGEVDMIVCYDAQKTPIRMLQRIGRTGRKREGFVHVLLSEAREEENMDKAKMAYKEVQKSILRGDQLELYGDVSRLIPNHVKPECLEKVMDIEEYVREDGKKRSSSSTAKDSQARAPKRKRNDDVGRNIPSGAFSGFVTAADLVPKGRKKKKPIPLSEEAFEAAGHDDEIDLEIEAGIQLDRPFRRTQSEVASSSAKAKIAPLRRAATAGTKKVIPKKASSKKVKKLPRLTSSQFDARGLDDNDDLEIMETIIPGLLKTSTPPRLKSPNHWPSSPNIPIIEIELTSSDEDHPLTPAQVPSHSPWSSGGSLSIVDHATTSKSPSAEPTANIVDQDQSMAWLVDEDDEPEFQIVDSSPLKVPRGQDDSVEIISPPPRFRALPRQALRNQSGAAPEFTVGSSTGGFKKASTLPRFIRSPSASQMPPPQIPPSFLAHTVVSDSENEPPAASFPVRRIGRTSKSRALLMEAESPLSELPPPSQRRIRRVREPSSPVIPISPNPARGKRRDKKILKANPWVVGEAEHSGDEVSAGSSHSEDDEESESDRQFLQELPETQVPLSYDQTLAYRRSLLTQAPLTARVPQFANKPLKRGLYDKRMENSRRRALVSSSPPREDDTPDEYSLGSFVVDDDEDILTDQI